MVKSHLVALLCVVCTLPAMASKGGSALENIYEVTARQLQQAKDKNVEGKLREKRKFYENLAKVQVGKTTVMQLLIMLNAPGMAYGIQNNGVLMTYYPPHPIVNEAYYHVRLNAAGVVVSVSPDGGP